MTPWRTRWPLRSEVGKESVSELSTFFAGSRPRSQAGASIGRPADGHSASGQSLLCSPRLREFGIRREPIGDDRDNRILQGQGRRRDGGGVGDRVGPRGDHARLWGEKVILADFNDENLERKLARLDKAYPSQTLGLHCDVTNEGEVQDMIRKAAEFGGRIDILFNNAGAGFGGNFDKLTNRHWEKAFALNFYGALYGIRAVLPFMRQQCGGQIVDIVSGIAFAPMAQMTQYSATKAALNALTLALRYELWTRTSACHRRRRA